MIGLEKPSKKKIKALFKQKKYSVILEILKERKKNTARGLDFGQGKIVPPPDTFQKSPVCKACTLQGRHPLSQNFARLAPCKVVTHIAKILQGLHLRLRLGYVYSLLLILFSKGPQGEMFWGILLAFQYINLSEQSLAAQR